MEVFPGLTNIVAVQEPLTTNQLGRAEVEILRKFTLLSSEVLHVFYELPCGNTHGIVHTELLAASCLTGSVGVADKNYDS